jgi:hypothetical protein
VVDDHDARERFNMTFRTGSLELIEDAARKLAHVSLDDALRILVVMAEKGDKRYQRAAARWTGRVISERHLEAADAHRVVALVELLPATPSIVSGRLLVFCNRR